MGEMQETLAALLGEFGEVTRETLARPSAAGIEAAGLTRAVTDTYARLGGRLPQPPINPGKWDVEFDGFAVELDEYLHFNRYRALTLASPIYQRLDGFPHDTYLGYCADHEAKCLASGGYGGKWTNPSCERQFGAGSPPKDLSGPGAPRWKQRAFYDFLKDLAPLAAGVRLARIAVWDQLTDAKPGLTVADVLAHPQKAHVIGLVQLVRSRSA